MALWSPDEAVPAQQQARQSAGRHCAPVQPGSSRRVDQQVAVTATGAWRDSVAERVAPKQQPSWTFAVRARQALSAAEARSAVSVALSLPVPSDMKSRNQSADENAFGNAPTCIPDTEVAWTFSWSLVVKFSM